MSDAVLAGFAQRRREWKKEVAAQKRKSWFYFWVVGLAILAAGGLLAPVLYGWLKGSAGVWAKGAVEEVSLWLVLTLALALAIPVCLGLPSQRGIEALRAKTAALLEVRLDSLPDQVLLLLQRYGQLELVWELIPLNELDTRLSGYWRDGLVLVVDTEETYGSDTLAFLRDWENYRLRQEMAKALEDELADIPEACHQALYLAEFERARVVQAG